MDPVPVIVKNILAGFSRKLDGLYAPREIRQLVYILFEEYMGWDRITVHMSLGSEVPAGVSELFDAALADLAAGRPVQYITKKAWFNGTLLKVDENVLIPRPETEELCAIVTADLNGIKSMDISILDIGTGSGCIAIDLKKQFPLAKVTATDCSTGALTIAVDNARLNRCDVSFIFTDILDETGWVTLGKFGVIVSNPPYVRISEKQGLHRNVTEFEPALALFVDDSDPLVFYRAISGFAACQLIPPARLYLEINERFGQEVKELVISFGFNEVTILKDFHGKDRFITAVLNQ